MTSMGGGIGVAGIKVMSAGAVKSMVAALGAEFERETGNKLDSNFGTAGSLRDRIKGGEVADLVILSESAIAELAEDSVLSCPTAASILAARSPGLSCARVRRFRTFPRPKLSSGALLNARSVAYTDPKAGGSGGIMFAALVAEARHCRRH